MSQDAFDCIVEIPKITRFVLVDKQLENKKVEVEGWFSREDAIKEIEASRARFRESSGHS
jgi:inorganic pyrophosphatase